MTTSPIAEPPPLPLPLSTLLVEDRARLVRLCAFLTGAPEAAEDLAQETLSEAWRSRHTLRDPTRQSQWLTGIARNICRCWTRTRATQRNSGGSWSGEHEPADALDIETDLDRAELATLLDRALALLPPMTRVVLIERYIEESSHAVIAARLGMSEGAVKVRIQRGKLALRRVLTTTFPEEAATFGVCETARCGGWEETRIWCPTCGQRRLTGRFVTGGPDGGMTLRCLTCNPAGESGYVIANANRGDADRILGGVQTYKPALTRTQAWVHAYYRSALARGVAICPCCNRTNALLIGVPPDDGPWLHRDWRFRVLCGDCGWFFTLSFPGSIFALPEVQRFWRAHPRMRTLPVETVTVDGSPAIVTRFASVTESANLAVISARETFAVLGIHANNGA